MIIQAGSAASFKEGADKNIEGLPANPSGAVL